MDITKTCDQKVSPGGTVNFSGTVTNCGNVTLTNVVVTDTVPGIVTNKAVLGPITLAPHTSSPYSGTYIVPSDFCGPLTDATVASADTVCGASVSSPSRSCTTTLTTSPALAVTKNCTNAP